MSKITIGISSCLLGNKVRYDGQHKYDPFLTVTLGAFMEYFPVCPEVECGLPVPRDAMRLVGDHDNPRLVTIKTGIDFTDKMKSWGETKLNELAAKNLCCFIFKTKSPSSSMERIKIYPSEGGVAQKNGVGIFAYKRWIDMLDTDSTVHGLIQFHSRHKFMLMAHSPEHYRIAGKITASTDKINIKNAQTDYLKNMMDGLKKQLQPGKI